MQMSLAFTGLSPKLWTPATPNLYTLTVELSRNKQVLDSASMAIGFRTFEVSGERFLLNGKPYRWLGANMGPPGLAPNDRALAHKFTSLMKEGDQNATRAVVHPYCEVWLDEADRQGVAVSLEGTWPWLLIGNSAIPSQESLLAWKSEWLTLMKRLRRHPSIVLWTVNNEMFYLWDDDPQRRKRKWNIIQDVSPEMRRIDPTRPIVLWSGYTRVGNKSRLEAMAPGKLTGRDDGDVDDLHTYGGTYVPSFMGIREFWAKEIAKQMTAGRPFISQEHGTPYPSTDTGHTERSYIRMWMPQTSRVGNLAYESLQQSVAVPPEARSNRGRADRGRAAAPRRWMAGILQWHLVPRRSARRHHSALSRS